MRLVFNLIHPGTSPIVQEQNDLPLVVRLVEIGAESQKKDDEKAAGWIPGTSIPAIR